MTVQLKEVSIYKEVRKSASKQSTRGVARRTELIWNHLNISVGPTLSPSSTTSGFVCLNILLGQSHLWKENGNKHPGFGVSFSSIPLELTMRSDDSHALDLGNGFPFPRFLL